MDYSSLIGALLDCRGERTQEVLLEHRHLVHRELVAALEAAVVELDKAGHVDKAAYFRFLGLQLVAAIDHPLTRGDPLDALLVLNTLLRAAQTAEADPSQLEALLRAESDRLDLKFARFLEAWAKAILAAIHPGQAMATVHSLYRLGSVLQDMPDGGAGEGVEVSLVCYQAALSQHPRDRLPQGWAGIQYNLGTAYSRRRFGDPAHNLEVAIRCYENALTVVTQGDDPTLWASLQNNLGNAYGRRLYGDRADNQERMIACLQQALKVHAEPAAPNRWAQLQNNLGIAYCLRIRGTRAVNLRAAIVCFDGALRHRPPGTEHWGNTLSNLGNAWRNLSQVSEPLADAERTSAVQQAVAAYEHVVRAPSTAISPILRSRTLLNLGNVWLQRREALTVPVLINAIGCLEEALQLIDRQAAPEDWAKAKNNLGIAYWHRAAIATAGFGSATDDWDCAISCLQDALTVRKAVAYPLDQAETLSNLGLTLQAAGRLQEAYQALHEAVTLLQNVRADSWSGAKVKERLAGDWHRLFQAMVTVCLTLGRTEGEYVARALEMVELSKARNLSELLTARTVAPKGDVPATEVEALRKLTEAIRLEQEQIDLAYEALDEFASFGAELGPRRMPDTSRLVELHGQREALIDRSIAPIDPTFRLALQARRIDFADIQALLPDERTVLVEWFVSENAIRAFIVMRDALWPVLWEAPAQALPKLKAWLVTYLDSYYGSRRTWQDTLPAQLSQFVEILDIAGALRTLPEICDQIIFVPHRFMHLLPLHALPLEQASGSSTAGPVRCLLDRFPRGVRYAPSCQLLQLAREWHRPRMTRLFAVQNPTRDLPFCDLEVELVRRGFVPNDQVLMHDAATKPELDRRQLAQAECVHFACHGHFDFERPRRSALRLADSNIAEAPPVADSADYLTLGDGISVDLRRCLTLLEIFALDLASCRLVILSACETGLIDVRSVSDEYMGLPSAFLYAGSPSIVSTLWAIEDFSAALLMMKFHQLLQASPAAEDGDVTRALNQAQLWLRDLTADAVGKIVNSIEPIFRTSMAGEHPALIDKRLANCRQALEARGAYPFANPTYWAGFTTMGV